jgi:chromosome segregation ATPase
VVNEQRIYNGYKTRKGFYCSNGGLRKLCSLWQEAFLPTGTVYVTLIPYIRPEYPPPSDAQHKVHGPPAQHLLEAEHADLLLKCKDLSRCYCSTQRELQELKSSPSAVPTSVVLSDMYMDLGNGYKELEQSYTREILSQEPLKARNREVERELQAMNDRLSVLRQDVSEQHRRFSNLEAQLTSASQLRQQFKDSATQCAELEAKLDQMPQAHSAQEAKFRDAQKTIDGLRSEVHDAQQVSEDLALQAFY